MTAWHASDEAERLKALQSLAVLDTAAEEQFDALVQAASIVCGVPISLLSLVDADRQWFKAKVGLAVNEAPREHALCARTILDDAIFEVPDASADPRFADNPLVCAGPGIRFYAGAPVVLRSGHRVGTLCVIDRKPGQLTPLQRQVLAHLATAAARGLEAHRLEHELVQEQARLSNILEATGAGTWEWDLRTNQVRYNARWAEIIGYTLDEVQGRGHQAWRDLVHPEDLPRADAAMAAHIEGRSDRYACEFRMCHRDGHWVWVMSHGRVKSRDAQGRPLWAFGTHLDVTESRQLAAELAEQHGLLSVTLRSIGDAVITTDTSARVVWLNPAAERLTGWLSDEARGLPVSQVFVIVHEGTREPVDSPVDQCLRRREVVGLTSRTLLLSRQGQEFGIEDSSAPIVNEAGELLGAVLVFHDVTEQRRLSGEVAYRASHDALTGLVNRVEFESRLRRLLAHAREFEDQHALLYIDLDQFKLVNDACGHSVGDELLKQVGRLLKEAVRASDTVARLGGDEFAVLLEACPAERAKRVAQQICDHMEEFRFQHDGRRFRIGTSIGLVNFSAQWPGVEAILQAADTSCYAAKEAGRNRVHEWYDTDLELRARHGQMQWTNRIEQALDEDGFVLYAQRIEALNGPAEGLHAEVLLRMRDPQGGLIPPGAFLPAAERFNLVSRIDKWVLRRTLAWIGAAGRATRLSLLSVNLSGQSVGDRAFQRWLIELLRGAGVEICARLCLEITETAAVTHMADASDFVDEVRRLGVRVALDDFGAGASSFGYLKNLRVDLLKIDGQFVRDVLDDPLDEVAVRSFVDVARVVGVQTVGEFVCTPALHARLRELGVDFAQGYHVHRPEPLDALVPTEDVVARRG
ncbi:MAG: EAL domain-containing protein [Burkholderiales bacterium]|nr:MAG: EAL domain-containing protein [Burkholderiales bacterium]